MLYFQSNALYDTERCHAFLCDLTTDALSDDVTRPVDVITMIFVLSAIHPDKMAACIRNVVDVRCFVKICDLFALIYILFVHVNFVILFLPLCKLFQYA